jgi:hypothetical protein
MSQKHYRAIADVIREERDAANRIELDQQTLVERIARGIANVCQDDNPRFNRSTFFAACDLFQDEGPQRANALNDS